MSAFVEGRIRIDTTRAKEQQRKINARLKVPSLKTIRGKCLDCSGKSYLDVQ